jgi:hypothetical protein
VEARNGGERPRAPMFERAKSASGSHVDFAAMQHQSDLLFSVILLTSPRKNLRPTCDHVL